MKIRDFLEAAERYYWACKMVECQDMTRLAKDAGVSRPVLYERLKRLGLYTPNQAHAQRRQNRGNAAWQALGNRVSSFNPPRIDH